MTGRNSKRNRSQKKTTRRRLPLPLWIALAGLAALATALLFDFDIGGRKVDFTPEVQGAAMKVDNEKIDYGDVRLGNTVKTEFRVTNIGSQDLRFESVPYVEVKEGC